MKKHYLIIGGINPKDENRNRYSNFQLANQAANSRWLWNLINGLEHEGRTVTVLNTPNLPSYQEDKQTLIHEGYEWSHNGLSTDYAIEYNNIFPLSIFSRNIAITRYCKEWINNTEGDKIIIGITPHFPIVNNLSLLSKKVKTCLIVPDLPDFTGTARMGNPVYKLLKNLDVKLFYSKIKHIDNFIVLTDKMKERIGLEKRFLRIECMVDPSIANIDDNKDSFNDERKDGLAILYSGTIHKHYGLLEVAKAISESDLHCKLLVCGGGPGVESILQISKVDKRIKYIGLLDPDEVIRLQRKSDILINPRPDDGSEYLNYSFPSKTLEYMAASKPVVCHKLRGIPDEYDDYLIYLNDNSKDNVLSVLSSLMKMTEDERAIIGKRNVDFVLHKKNIFVQTKKIIDFIE